MSSDKTESRQIETFRQGHYSLREIDKELNRSKTVVWSYLKAPEEYGQELTKENPRY